MKKRWMIPAVVLAMAFFLAAMVRTHVDPMIRALAEASVNDAASNLINAAIEGQLTDDGTEYEELVRLERDNSGNIAALTTNMRELNLLKTQVLERLDREIFEINEYPIGIPAGNLTGIQLMSGRGPRIPVEIVSVSSSDGQFRGEFLDAGINQTIHRIYLTVSMDLMILLPSGTVTDRVCSEVCVAETVLLGRVPDSYTYFNTSDAGLFAATE